MLCIAQQEDFKKHKIPTLSPVKSNSKNDKDFMSEPRKQSDPERFAMLTMKLKRPDNVHCMKCVPDWAE